MIKPEHSRSTAYFDLLRSRAGAELDTRHYDDFQRLVRTVRYGSATQLLLAEFDDVRYREDVIERIDAVAWDVGLRPGRYVVGAGVSDVRALEDELATVADDCQLIHLVGDQTWFDDLDDPRWEELNLRREAFFKRIPVKLVFWLTPSRVAQLARGAPDLWAWRGGVYDFALGSNPTAPAPRLTESFAHRDAAGVLGAGRRIAELRGALRSSLPDELRLPALDELATLEQRVGNLDEALSIRRDQELPSYERRGDARSAAVTRGKIADILQTRGELDEALRIHREEQLPVYEKLGDTRSAAITWVKIADLLRAGGENDEALRVFREQTLPVFERLGDIRAAAMTQGRIADILETRGEHDEALRIRSEEELPVYERLGDVRSAATTRKQIADARGRVDDARVADG
jgi:tetratricopeptide (TPR) repeat protein